MNETNLVVGPSKRVDDRVFIPVAEVSKLESQRGVWIQAVPMAIVIVEKEREYILPVTEEITLEKLKERIPRLDEICRYYRTEGK